MILFHTLAIIFVRGSQAHEELHRCRSSWEFAEILLTDTLNLVKKTEVKMGQSLVKVG